MKRMRSEAFFARAQKLMPGGVNSPVRNFGRVGGHPVFMARGKGAKVYDADGNEYIDYIQGMGPNLFGHSPDFINEQVNEDMQKGYIFAGQFERELEALEVG